MSDTVLYAPTDPAAPSRKTPPIQTYKNHVRRDTVFMVAGIILMINFCVVTVTAVRYDLAHFTWMTILWVAVAFATVIIAVKARSNPIKVQDRLIRLEETLRYATLLPESLRHAANALTVKQIVALRFASDAELPTLIQRALTENLTPKQIKESIVTWRPDHLRV